jgi:outer membrane assembly lipoprotein YfiO
MRSFLSCFISVVFLTAISGCGGPQGAKLQTSVIPPDKTLYENGSEYLEKNQFIKARLAFQTLIRTYPGSDLEADAYLAMGDSFYREGGTENWLLAEDQYRNFIIFFPTNPKAADAQMKIIALLMRQMNDPDRDQGVTRRAETEIVRMMDLFPDSDYIPIVRQYLDDVRENLALSDLRVGDFYSGQRNYAGALSRYQELTDKYPHFSRMDEAYFKISEIMKLAENPEELENYLTRIVTGYPFSKYYEQAKAELESLGKPVPEVDPALAEQNQSFLKAPEPFSPLKPLISFAEAIGFKGPPDRYQEAKKIIAANQAAAAAADAASAQTGANGDVLINVTLAKGADGKPVTGTNAKDTQAKTDKKDDTKQDPTKKVKKAA